MRLFLFPFFFIITSFLFSQHFSIQSSVNKRTVLIGDKIKYQVDLEFEEGLKVMKPGPGANLGQFEVKNFEIVPAVLTNGIVYHSIIYTIAIYEAGDFTLPAAEAMAFINGTNKVFLSRPISIEVNSSLNKDGDDSSIRDIKLPSTTFGKIPQRYFIYFFVFLAFIILIASLWWFRKKLFFKPKLKANYLIAFDAINDLMNLRYLEKKEFKPFYYALSMIIRRYLENEKGIHSTTETTREIKAEIKKLKIENGDMYLNLFTYADKVKFSTFTPSEEKTQGFVIAIKKELLKDKEKIEKAKKQLTNSKDKTKSNV